MSINNLLPLLGAIIPSLYLARYSIPQGITSNVFFTKFTLNLIWSLLVVVFSCLTIHVGILDREIVWGHDSPTISMTLLHYIVVVGFGSILLANFFFGILTECCGNKKAIPFVYCFLNILVLLSTAHILFIQHFFILKD